MSDATDEALRGYPIQFDANRCSKCGTELQAPDGTAQLRAGAEWRDAHSNERCLMMQLKSAEVHLKAALAKGHAAYAALREELVAMTALAQDWRVNYCAAAESLIRIGATLTRVTEAMLPSARLVWENGGYSGASGNWPLVAAYGKLEALEKTDAELYARIREKP